jgi:hypothetical protein
MNKPFYDFEDKLYVESSELWYRGVHNHEVREQDVQHDYTRPGMWVNRNSPTAVIMSLKGVNFLTTHLQVRHDGQQPG